MIIKSYRGTGKPGQYVPHGEIIDHHGINHKQPFMIIEEVTKDDYLRECKVEDKPIGMIFNEDRFYRVSID